VSTKTRGKVKSASYSPLTKHLFFIKVILLFFCSFSILSAAWVNNFGTSAPTNSAVNLDVNRNFQLLFGGSNSSLYGDIVATGDSILNVPDKYSGYLALANSTYMLSDNSFATDSDLRKRNSSTATLNLPPYVEGKDIIFAGLFWQGLVHEESNSGLTTTNVDNSIINWNKITFKTPDGVPHNLTASLSTKDKASKTYHYTYKDDDSFHHHYSAFVDVTNLVQNSYSSSNNTFTAGHILTTAGTDFGDSMYFAYEQDTNGLWNNGGGVRMGYYGGWSLIVVYSLDQAKRKLHPEVKLKNISIYDGYDQFAIWKNTDPLLVSVNINGFLTPKSGAIDSKLLIFGGAGDYNIAGDKLNIFNKATNSFEPVSNPLNPEGNQFNSTYSYLGNDLTSKHIRNGVDLDTYDVSSKMIHNQTNTAVQFGVQQLGKAADQIHPQVIAFSTELYEPQLCYDYSYEQNGIFFTEDNNGSNFPRIVGKLNNNNDVNVKIYLRNSENSDISAKNLKIDILDINTTQAIYTRNSTSVVYPREVQTTPISDSDLNVSNAYIRNIDLQNMNGQQSSYIYYSLTPQNISDINISIDAEVSFDLVLENGNTFHYTNQKLGSQNIPLCSSNNFKYTPIKGRFTVVDNNFYSDTNGSKYYNLPTQVTKREGNFKVLSLKPSSPDEVQDLNYSTIVAVDLIDVSSFHDTTAACEEESSAVSKKVWIMLAKNTHSKTFDKTTLQNAINAHMTELTNSSEFYGKALKNAAMRVSYNMADGNGSLVHTQPASKPGNSAILNFTELAQGLQAYNSDLPPQDRNKCVRPVTIGNKTYTTMPESCGNASLHNGISPEQLTICMQCVYGVQTKNFCSRDNFSIRPDSFHISLYDQNQTTGSNKTKLNNNNYTVSNATTARISNIAAGYSYKIDINATNFTDTIKALGYSTTISNTSDENNFSVIWDPRSAPTNCNDTSNRQLSTLFSNGFAENNISIQQVGEYQIHLIDTTWTSVDHDPALMTHHTGVHFLPANTPDCTINSSATQDLNSALINGCNISSDHNNTASNLYYKNYYITLHPYKFNLDSLSFSKGADFNASINNSFIYISNVDDNISRNMAWHAIGYIQAQGFDNSNLSNFVTGCFAKDINLTVTRTMPTTLLSSYRVRFSDFNSSDTSDLHDINATNIISDLTHDINKTNIILNVNNGNFTKDMNGAINTRIDMNFDRITNHPTNPMKIIFDTFDVKCSNENNCTFQADLNASKTTQGIKDVNATLTHYYGRVHAPDYRFPGDHGNATIYYEAYSDQNKTTRNSFNINGSESVDSINWYVNTLHGSSDGNVSRFVSVGETTVNGYQDIDSSGAFANGKEIKTLAHAAPYKDKIDMNVSSSPWLKFNPTDFMVEFDSNGSWAGQGLQGKTVDLNISIKQNKRLDW